LKLLFFERYVFSGKAAFPALPQLGSAAI
jgi:hypothetical protein